MSSPTLWGRLKKVRAVQILVVYLGASWFVLQLVGTLHELLSLPSWIGPVTVVLLGVGGVVVGATAWVQSLDSTTAAEEAGEIPTDWEIAPADIVSSLKSGRLPHLTWGRAILGGIVSISLAIGAAGAYVLVTGGGLTQPLGAEGVATGIAVLPFQVSGPGLDVYAEGMVSLVSTNIDGVDGFRSISNRTVIAAWNDAFGDRTAASLEDQLEVAGGTGARYAVVGDAVSVAGTVVFNAELYDLVDGSSVGRGQAEGPIDQVLSVIDEMSVDLLRTLLAQSGTQTATGIQRLSGLITGSVEALGAYLEGESLYRHGQTREALGAYERAVEADSTFALAWARIGDMHGWLNDDRDALVDARTRALAGADRLPQRVETLLRAKMDVTLFRGSRENFEGLRRYVRRFPDDPAGWEQLGEYILHIQSTIGTPAELEEALLTTIELDPETATYYVHPLRYFVGRGDRERFHEYIAKYAEVVTEDRVERYQNQWDFYWGSDDEIARAAAFYRENPASAANLLSETLLMSDGGADRDLALLRLLGDERPPVFAYWEAVVLWNQGRIGELRELQMTPPRTAAAMLEGFASQTAIVSNSPVAGIEPNDAVARVLATADEQASLVETFPVDDSTRGLMITETRTWVEASELLEAGRANEARIALDNLETMGAFNFGGVSWWRIMMAEALARSGREREAIRFYEARLSDHRALSRLRLGELYEAVGEPEQARANYEGFLTLYGGADEGGQALLERGRNGLSRVGG